MNELYTELRLKLLTGAEVGIGVDPPFATRDLEYFPGIRAVSLGNLTVLYEGLIYDVIPAGRQPPKAPVTTYRTP